MVLAPMRYWVNDLQILNAVVSLYSVLVVDKLFGTEWAPYMSLHNYAMKKSEPPINLGAMVSGRYRVNHFSSPARLLMNCHAGAAC